MFYSRTLLLALLLTACGQSGAPSRGEATEQLGGSQQSGADFLELAKGDPWAKPPQGLQENPADNGQDCERVSEQTRQEAIALLEKRPAVAVGA